MENRHRPLTDPLSPDFTAFEAAVRDRLPQRTTVPTAALEGVARLGRLVQTLRTKQRWSLQMLATRTGLSWLWLALLERGMLLPTELTPDVMQKLGQAFPVHHAMARSEVLFHTLVEDLLQLQVPSPEAEEFPSLEEAARPTLRDHVEGLVRWLSERWHPRLAGGLATAAESPPQDKTFYLDEGTIRVTCTWWPTTRDRPAALWMQWHADITRPGELWVRFTRTDPEAAMVLAELSLGQALAGEATWSTDTLGFDPSREPWALALVLREAMS